MNKDSYTMLLMDQDDYLGKIKLLTEKRDSLQERLELEEQMISRWNHILSCSTAEELKNVTLDAPEVEELFVDVWKDVIVWQELSTSLQVYNIIGVQVMEMKDGFFVEFSSLCGYQSEKEPSIFLAREDTNKYRVNYADLVNDVPLKELEELYLDTAKEEGLVQFFHSVNRYQQSFFLRKKQLEEIKTFVDGETVNIYHNKHLTVVALTLKLEIDGEQSVVEMKLLYRPLDHRPYEVTYHYQSGAKLKLDVKTRLEGMEKSFYEKALVEVFKTCFFSSDEDEEESESMDSFKSSSTIEFGI